MLKYILSVATLIAVSLSLNAQTKTVQTLEDNNDGYNLFMYQSVIRVLNKDNNEEFNLLVKDLEYIKAIVTDSIGESAKTQYKTLLKSIKSEGFSELFMIDNKEMKASIYEKENQKGESEYVAFMYYEPLGKTGAFEMKGSLDLRYINAFESLDFKKLKELAESQN
ncbi:MAG: DUF4252 domain-containing protein [Flavobacteriales bacterium]